MDILGLTGDSKLAVGVDVSVNAYLSLPIGPVIDWQPVADDHS